LNHFTLGKKIKKKNKKQRHKQNEHPEKHRIPRALRGGKATRNSVGGFYKSKQCAGHKRGGWGDKNGEAPEGGVANVESLGRKG